MFPGRRNRWVTFDCYGTLVGFTASPALHSQVGAHDQKVKPWPAVRPLDDVEPLLAELRRRGYRLGVLTNWDDAKFEAAHRTFRHPFDLFVTAERVRGRKPDLWHFRAFQMLAQVRKDDWVHIASDWQHDIVPAESFGIQRVWLDRQATGEDPALTAQTAPPRRVGPRTRADQPALLGVRSLRDPTGGGGAHVHTAAEAVRAVDWLFQDRAVCAS